MGNLVSNAISQRVPDSVGGRGVDDAAPGLLGAGRAQRAARIPPHALGRAALSSRHWYHHNQSLYFFYT